MNNIINENDLDILLANAQKPVLHDFGAAPLNSLDDRAFEILLYTLYKKRIEASDKILLKTVDQIQLMSGVADSGFDCRLLKKNKVIGLIQCKKYQRRLDEKVLLKEFIKFSLDALLNPNLRGSEKKFQYKIATTTGFTRKAFDLIARLNNNEFDDDITAAVKESVQKNKRFSSLKFTERELMNQLLSSRYEPLLPEDIQLMLSNFADISSLFFEVKKVTDNSLINEATRVIISRIDKFEDFLTQEKLTDKFQAFIMSYRKVALNKLNVINFIGFDLHKYRQRPNEITLTDLFVQPDFRVVTTDENKKYVMHSPDNVRDVKIANLFQSDKNIVILGDPGAGKSLLVKFIIVKLLENKADEIGLRSFANHVPFRVELRKFNEFRDRFNLVGYIIHVLNLEYQCTLDNRTLTKLLNNGVCVILFDGLDEIFNPDHKNEVKQMIEAFVGTYPKCKFILTSRFIGYHDVTIDKNSFAEFAIQRLNDEKIIELVTRFYSSQIANTDKRKTQIAGCLEQLRAGVDPGLKSNPLILTLILILASNNIIIPDSKLEIYESCTKTLVDSLDEKKEIKFSISVISKRRTFAHLAYWQYECQSTNQKVTYLKAIHTLGKYLMEKKEAEDRNEAEDKARQFLDYAEKRSIYFEDNFTHKTFLEYYTADYLFIKYFTKAKESERNKLDDIIARYLTKSFWYIVFELLFSRIDKEQEDSEVLDSMIEKQMQINFSNLNLYLFFFSVMHTLQNVSADMRKKLLYNGIRLITQNNFSDSYRANFIEDENSILYCVNNLGRDPVHAQILQGVFNQLENDLKSNLQLISLYSLNFELISTMNIRRSTARLNIQIANKNKLEELSLKDIALFSFVHVSTRWNRDSKFDFAEVIKTQTENFGINSVFQNVHFRYRSGYRVSLFNLFLLKRINEREVTKLTLDLKKLEKVGLTADVILNKITSQRLPVFSGIEFHEQLIHTYSKSKDRGVDSILLTLIKQNRQSKATFQRIVRNLRGKKIQELENVYSIVVKNGKTSKV